MTTAVRTDIHRPSAPEFDPEAYTFLGCFDLGFDAADWVGPGPAATVSAQVKMGNTFRGAPHGSGQCSHCGARMRYAALMLHEETHTLMYVGETCLDNRFSLTKAEFTSLRKAALENRTRQSRQAQLDALVAEYPVLAWASYAHNIGAVGAETQVVDGEEYYKPGTDLADRARVGYEISTLSDLWYKASRYLSVSERQVAFVEKLLTRLSERVEAFEAQEARKAEAVESGVQVPTGRMEVVGTVLSVRVEEEWFGYSRRTVEKMLVQHESGWKVWGTVPASLSGVEKGSRVKFTATVKPSGDDPLFGFQSRPTKGEVL